MNEDQTPSDVNLGLTLVITDHKPPLFSVQKPISLQSSAKIQRWRLTLSSYEYKLLFGMSTDNANADAFSCLPVENLPSNTPLPTEVILLLEHFNSSPVTVSQIRTHHI